MDAIITALLEWKIQECLVGSFSKVTRFCLQSLKLFIDYKGNGIDFKFAFQKEL